MQRRLTAAGSGLAARVLGELAAANWPRRLRSLLSVSGAANGLSMRSGWRQASVADWRAKWIGRWIGSDRFGSVRFVSARLGSISERQ